MFNLSCVTKLELLEGYEMKLDSEEFKQLNNRRVELIHNKNKTPEEELELKDLSKQVNDIFHTENPNYYEKTNKIYDQLQYLIDQDI